MSTYLILSNVIFIVKGIIYIGIQAIVNTIFFVEIKMFKILFFNGLNIYLKRNK